MRPWSHLRDTLARDGRAAMVTVVATKGSAPREAGARLIVHPDGSFTGTVGGGALEWRAIALAQSLLSKPAADRVQIRKFALGPELGQCCGGQVELIVELIGERESAMVADLAAREASGVFVTRATVSATEGVRREVVGGLNVSPDGAIWEDNLLLESFGGDPRPLLLFGAGHVGRALVMALAPLPFRVTWVDPRPDAFPAHIPANVTTVQADDPTTVLSSARDGTFVLAMTHSHPLDLAVSAAALGDTRFPYVGVIGSKTKRARFSSQLRAAGVPPGRIANLVCPIGVGAVHSKLPAVIAAMTAVELLERDETLKARVVDRSARA